MPRDESKRTAAILALDAALDAAEKDHQAILDEQTAWRAEHRQIFDKAQALKDEAWRARGARNNIRNAIIDLGWTPLPRGSADNVGGTP